MVAIMAFHTDPRECGVVCTLQSPECAGNFEAEKPTSFVAFKERAVFDQFMLPRKERDEVAPHHFLEDSCKGVASFVHRLLKVLKSKKLAVSTSNERHFRSSNREFEGLELLKSKVDAGTRFRFEFSRYLHNSFWRAPRPSRFIIHKDATKSEKSQLCSHFHR